jgi:hypothetical protein
MKKLLAMLLAVALLVALAACRDSEEPQPTSSQEPTTAPSATEPTTVPAQPDSLVGAWRCKLIVDARKMQLEGVDASMECYIEAEFSRDMTYRVTIDQDALADSAQKFLDAVKDDVLAAAYREYQKQGLTMEQVDNLIQKQYGVTLQELCQRMLEKMDVKEMLAEYGDLLPTAGTYREDGDTLYLTQPDGDGGFEEVAFSYELKNGKLRLSSEDEDVRKFFDFVGGAYLEFTRK